MSPRNRSAKSGRACNGRRPRPESSILESRIDGDDDGDDGDDDDDDGDDDDDDDDDDDGDDGGDDDDYDDYDGDDDISKEVSLTGL